MKPEDILDTPQYYLLAASSRLGKLLLRGGTVEPFKWDESIRLTVVPLRTTPEAEILRRGMGAPGGDWLLLEGTVTGGRFVLFGCQPGDWSVTVTFTRIAAYLFPNDHGAHTNAELLAEYHRLTLESPCSP